jgi:hypothetical protein
MTTQATGHTSPGLQVLRPTTRLELLVSAINAGFSL